MDNILKKAIGLFVEITPEEGKRPPVTENPGNFMPASINKVGATDPIRIEPDKFAKHFEELFAKANLPGPDYFEFWKMMETLTPHVPDEKSRMVAVFNTLMVQGLTKLKLLETAGLYQVLVQKDQDEFRKAVDQKIQAEIEGRKKESERLEQAITTNSETIRRLTQEITEHQAKLNGLKLEMSTEESKLNQNRNGYHLACEAMMDRINSDIKKIEQNL